MFYYGRTRHLQSIYKMAVYQRDIVDVNYQLPNGKFKPHSVIIISNDEIFEIEQIFYGVMLSTSRLNDDYIFEITEDMVTKPKNKDKSFVKCQLIQAFSESEIVGRHGAIKKVPFEKLKQKIIDSIF